MKSVGFSGLGWFLSVLVFAPSLLRSAPGDLKWHLPVSITIGPLPGTNGLLYGASEQGQVYAWNAASGQTGWETNVGGNLNYSMLVIGPNNHLYLPTYSGLHALDGATGRELWHFDEQFSTLAVGADGTVFASFYEGMFALDPLDGRKRWAYLGQLSGIPALSANGLIYTCASFGRMLALDAATGTRVWEFQNRTASFSSLIVAREGTVLVHGFFDLSNYTDERLLALDGATGKPLWQFALPGQMSGIIIADGSVCVGTYPETIHVLDPLTGNPQREIALGLTAFGSMTLAADGTLYLAGSVPDGTPHVFALDFDTGNTNWFFSPTNYGIGGLNIGADGTLYFHNHYLYGGLSALHGSSPLANTAWPKSLQNAQNTSLWNPSGPPLITRQPLSQWAALDASTAFHFHSPVTRPLHIQWRFNGQPIPGATNESLRIEPVRFAHAGNYLVAISNQFGSTISDEATLSVGYTLTLLTTGPGVAQRVPDLEVYPTNTVVHLTAVPATNRNFLGWSGDATGVVQTLYVTLDRNYNVHAAFEYLRGDLKWQLPEAVSALSPDGTLAYGQTIYRYFAIDTTTGRIVWEVGSGAENYSPPAVGPEGNVYYTSYGDQLIALDGRTGALKWAFDIGVCTDTPAAVAADGTIYFGGAKLYAIDPVTGLEKWSFPRGGTNTTEGVGGRLAIGPNGVVYAAGSWGVSAFHGLTGEKLRDYGMLNEWGLPTISSDNLLYFASTDGILHAFDGYTGQLLWESTNGPARIGADGTVYARNESGKLVALNGRTGELTWESDAPGVSAIGADGTLLVATTNKFMGVSSTSGAVLWEVEGLVLSGFNIGPDGTIYNGNYVIHGTNPLALGGWPKGAQNPQNSHAVRVQGAPMVTRPPAGRWAAHDGSTTFEFYSSNYRPLHVQWQFNGQDIPGATNELLTIQGLHFTNAGNYTVVLSNAFGVITSGPPAVLSIGYELVVAIEGLGTVQRSPDLAVYPPGAVVQLLATPQSPRNFHGWTGDVSAQTNTIEITLTQNHHVTANFEFLPGDKKWAFPTAAYWLDSTPAIGHDGTLYFTGGGILYAVDSVTRQKKWESQPAGGSPALGADGTVYVGSGSKVYAFDGVTGTLKWASMLGVHERIQNSPAVGIDGTVYIGGSNFFYALDGRTGVLKWMSQAAGSFMGSPAIGADGTIFCPAFNGKVYAWDGLTGATKWEFTASNNVSSSPALGADGTVYIGAWYGKVYALHPRTGGVKWQFDTTDYVLNSPAIGPDGTVYIGTSGNRLHALNGTTGQLKWNFQAVGDVNPPAIGADGTVYFISSQGTLYAIEASTGESKWESLITEEWGGRAAPTLASDGTLYVGPTGEGHYTGGLLVAVHTSSSLANSPWPKFRGQLDNRARVHSRPLFDRARSQLTASGFELILHTEPGETVELQTSPNLQAWTPLATLTTAESPIRFTDTNAPSQRFYRAVLAP